MRERTLGLGAALLLLGLPGCGLLGCGPPMPPASPPYERPAPTEACEMPPIFEGSREACLRPPYAPAEETAALPDGTPIARADASRSGEEGRRWIVTLPGEPPAGHEAETALLRRLRQSREELRFLNRGLYCHNPDHLCFALNIDLCSDRVEEVAARFLEALAADPELPRPGGELLIELVGRSGPRCDPSEGECEPLPFGRSGEEYDPEAPRGERFHLGGMLGGACEHDGECLITGCGNRCFHWGCAAANRASTCEGYVFSRPVFCGCVEGQCGWFDQQ